MRAAFAERIVAYRLHFQVDAREIREQFRNARDGRDREIAHQHDRPVWFVRDDLIEIVIVDAAMMQQAAPQFRFVDTGRPRERREFAFDVGYLRRNQPDDERRTAAHEHFSVAVVDDAARCGDRNEPDLIGECGGAIPVSIDQLDLHETHHQRQKRQHDGQRERRDSPRRALPRRAARGQARRAHERLASTRRTTSIAISITATFITACSSASRKCIAPSPGG